MYPKTYTVMDSNVYPTIEDIASLKNTNLMDRTPFKGRKNNDQKEVIQCYLMASGRQISRVFAVFSIFKGITPPGASGIKFTGFSPFSRMCGNPVKKKIDVSERHECPRLEY
jgi:hypothetical protein